MSWREVIITQRCKLDYSMNYMVIRGEDTKRILLDEIAILMIENYAVSLTGCLLSALVEKKIKVILCDPKRSPQAELVPYYGAHNDVVRIKQQIEWEDDIKKNVWTKIVEEKIRNQSKLLKRYGFDMQSDLLNTYIDEMVIGDATNREGHSAKVYFNALFGMQFKRSDTGNVVNGALNYGYAILLSAFNREVISNGYLTQIGLCHNNQFNHFNLSCDLMEPFRVIIDDKVKNMNMKEFGTNEKHILVDELNMSYKINGMEQTLLNSIRIFTKSIFVALNERNPELISFLEI